MGWTGHETDRNVKNINNIRKEQFNKDITQERSKMWEGTETREGWSDGERS
jgi:hypothetical protein